MTNRAMQSERPSEHMHGLVAETMPHGDRGNPENRKAVVPRPDAPLQVDKVDEKVICDFADPQHDQQKLLGALSWASFTAARRIGSWLAAGAGGSASSLEISLQ